MYKLILYLLILTTANVIISITGRNIITITVTPNEPVTSKLSIKGLPSNLTSAIVIKTNIIEHNDYDELLPAALEENPATEYEANISIPSQASKSKGHVFMTAVYMDNVNHWSLDLHGEYYKTLCTTNQKGVSNPKRQTEISIGIYSTRETNITLEIEITEKNFEIELDHEVEVVIDGSSTTLLEFLPQYELYNYGEERDETYLLSIMSQLPDEFRNCLHVAIHEPGCPWHDSEGNFRNSRMWARILKVGYFPVDPHVFNNGFLISIIPAKNSSDCWSRGKKYEISDKNILKLKIEKTLNSYSKPVGTSIGSMVIVALVFSVLIIWSWYQNFILNKPEDNIPVTAENGAHDENVCNTVPENGKEHRVTSEGEEGGEQCYNTSGRKLPFTPESAYRDLLVADILREHQLRCQSRRSEHCTHAVERLKNNRQNLKDMTMMASNPWHRRQRSKAYIYLIPLVSMFYLIPSAQMVYTEYIRSKESGNMEKCYLNYGCSRPYGIFTDFNHIVSNIGYIIYGIMFILIVYIKSKMLPEGHQTHEDHDSEMGPLQQHSIFYSMGVCMIFQGVFSSIFHMCPSNLSLQFDTTMMYIMMILVFIKLYQLRHPDIAYNAYHVMYAFSIVLVFEALSLYIFDYTARLILFILFMLFYFMFMIHIAVDIYYYGALKTNPTKLIPIFVKHAMKYNKEVLYRNKLIMGMVFVIFNLVIAIFILRNITVPGKSLSTPILVIGGANIILYIAYYYLKKCLEVRPKICPIETDEEPQVPVKKRQIFLFLLSFILQSLTIIIGMVAAYFYSNKHQSRNSTPPESRNMNDICYVMDFFDNHDMWHFTSATALFLAFIGLLTVDDDIIFVNRKDIRVF